jgi:hypothetical protein
MLAPEVLAILIDYLSDTASSRYSGSLALPLLFNAHSNAMDDVSVRSLFTESPL